MTKYTTRVTNEPEGITAWVDVDGAICIKQPNSPGLEGNWTTEADAKAWADKHAAELEEMHLSTIAAAVRKKEMEDAQHAANLAAIDTAAALKALVENLTK
jgi:hypothetical protein